MAAMERDAKVHISGGDDIGSTVLLEPNLYERLIACPEAVDRAIRKMVYSISCIAQRTSFSFFGTIITTAKKKVK